MLFGLPLRTIRAPRIFHVLKVKATDTFRARAARLLAAEEREALYAFLADNPTAGDIVGGTGGVRKLRWRMAGRGTRGGARVLQLYLRHVDTVWLLEVYGKRENADLSPADVKAIKAAVAIIKQAERLR